MGLKKPIIVVIFLFYFAALSPECVFPGGFYLPHQTARGVGLSNALTAGVDDPSAVYYNPAALGEVEGNQILVTGSYINTINSVENSGREAENEKEHNFTGSLFGNYHFTKDLTWGLGVYTPFGLATSYGGGFTRFGARQTELRTIYVTPAASWKINQYLSVGGGFSFVHGSAILSRSLCFDPTPLGCTSPLVFPRQTKLRLTASDNAYSYNVGILVKPIEKIKIGFSYRGRADLHFNNADTKFSGDLGTTKLKANVRPIPLPAIINLGVFWQMTPSWGAEIVYEYQRWSEFKDIRATFSSAPFGIFPRSFALNESWKNSSTVRLGSFYRLTKNIELRGGIGLEESPIPDKTLNPAIPGADLLTLNGGLGYKWEKFFVDLGYQAVFYETRRVRNSELEGGTAPGSPFAGAPGKDKYKTFNNFVSLSLGYRF
jgi:long-chain fatty acid transport protein